MIIARSPLRITLGGGGTDTKEFYSQFGGFCISAAIDQYVYVSISNTYSEEMLIRYSQIEKVKEIKDIHHPIIKAALQLTGITGPNLEITSMADQPAGTGLGSSGSFTTCLLKALYKIKKQFISQEDLAKTACHIEIDLLKEPIGKQDQYISACGGLTVFSFNKDETVNIEPLNITDDIVNQLEHNLLMVPTGFHRAASTVLQEQKDKCNKLDIDMINNLQYVKDIGYRSREALENGNLNKFGELLHEHWENKKKRSFKMSNVEIDNWYNFARDNGAIGGKLIGAGSGGFLLFYTEDKIKLKKAFKAIGLKEVPIKFDYEGSKII
jgi:D-glycero-alpha-D-manno-heptose-7-phosphate kinase